MGSQGPPNYSHTTTVLQRKEMESQKERERNNKRKEDEEQKEEEKRIDVEQDPVTRAQIKDPHSVSVSPQLHCFLVWAVLKHV